jgi:hypothetical protein
VIFPSTGPWPSSSSPKTRLGTPPHEASGYKRVKDPDNTLDTVHVIPSHRPIDLNNGDWIEIEFK